MSPTRLIRASAPLALGLSLVAAAGPAQAADPPGKSITAVASARAAVDKDGLAQNSRAIGAAVEAARARAVASAIAAAREEAGRVAGAGGLTLGELWSVEEIAPGPYGPFGSYGSDGTFGPGKYCGTVRHPIFRRLPSGRRVLAGRGRPRFTCRVPGEVSQTVSVTFAATGAGLAPAS